MPSISFFADAKDVPVLVEHLNEDPDLAFLVPPDPSRLSPGSPQPEATASKQPRWRAARTVANLGYGERALWHTPTGDLRYVVPSPKLLVPQGAPIADPWGGWDGPANASGVIPLVHAGPGDHGIVRLDLRITYGPFSAAELANNVLGASSFEWIGSRYQPAPKEMTRWWNGLKRWLSRTCAKLTDAPTGRQTFYAFPSALALLKAGIKYDARGWDLDASIRAATPPPPPKGKTS